MEQKKNINLGLNLIRVWLSFEVVIDHYWHQKGLTGVAQFLSGTRSLAVPCFLLMSFYLTAGRYASSDGAWFRSRLGRLLGPYLVWPLVYCAVILVAVAVSPAFVTVTDGLTELKYYHFSLASLDIWDLVRQYLCGLDRRLVHQFWFHHNLIIWTVAMFLLLKFVVKPRVRNYVLSAIMMVCFALQYSPLNRMLFDPLSFEVKYSFGRLVATAPYAALGLMIGFNRQALSRIGGSLKVFLSLAGLFLLFFVFYSDGFTRPKGLGYEGINLILMALGAVTFFHYLPLEHAPQWLARAIGLVSRYCMGIYCCHLAVGWVLHAWVFPKVGIGVETFAGCVAIWVVSWVLCLLVALIPGRFAKSMVE